MRVWEESLGNALTHQFRAFYSSLVLDRYLPIHGVYVSPNHIFCVTEWGCIRFHKSSWRGDFYPHIRDQFNPQQRYTYAQWMEQRLYSPYTTAWANPLVYPAFPYIGPNGGSPEILPQDYNRGSGNETSDIRRSESHQEGNIEPGFALPSSVLQGPDNISQPMSDENAIQSQSNGENLKPQINEEAPEHQIGEEVLKQGGDSLDKEELQG
jgi:hypothetical protein